MENDGKSPILVDFTKNALLGELGPQKSLGHATGEAFARPRSLSVPKSPIFMKIVKFHEIHEISWKFAKFREQRAAGAPKSRMGDLALDSRPIPVATFTPKSEKFHNFHEKRGIFMENVKFPHFHRKWHFLPKSALWAIWAPQTTKKRCAMELFPPLAEKVRFFAKSRTFRSFSHFSQKSTFSWFSWFLWKTWFSESSNGYRVQKVQKGEFQWFLWNFH